MPTEVYQFENFELDAGAYQLRRAGRVVPLERIPLDLLLLLVERRGQLVTRQEIIERIWGKDVFVDSDSSVNTAVRKVRQALKDNPEKPRLLQTVAGKGYRFVPPVAEPGPVATQSPIVPETEMVPAAAAKPRPWPLWLGAALVLVAAALFARPYLLLHVKPGSTRAMLAVLPFVNLSGDTRQEYFADGMTEEMITELGSLDPARLGVIARTSAMQYKNTRKDAGQIARELRVNYVLEGSIRRAGDRVRVTAQLIQTSDQTHIWAESFDRDLGDVIRLQSEVARVIADKIRLTLSRQMKERLAGAPHINAEVHEAYLQGLQAWNQRTAKSFEMALANFKHALAVYPGYAPAYAGLARVYTLAPIFGGPKPAESMARALEAATHAIALDDTLADAHTSLAFVKAHYQYDWPGADREFRRALELNPSDAYGHFFYSNSYLSPFGRHEEAIAEMKKAIELDPLSIPIQSFAGHSYFWARRYHEAFAQYRTATQMDPNFALNHERLAHLSTYVGRFEEAIDEETKARMLAGEDPKAALAKADALRQAVAERGPRGYWEKMLELSRTSDNPPEAYVTSYGFAIICSRLGENGKALDYLEKACAERQLAITEIGIEPAFDGLRSEPRFAALLRRVGVSR